MPTIFSPATTPRTISNIRAAVSQLVHEVQQELVVLAISIVGGMIMRQVFRSLARASGSGGRPVPRPQRIRPVNGTVNVGGGLEPNAATATNLNPIVPNTGGPTSGIPNHVRAGFEQIGEVFEVGSVNTVISNRLPFNTVNWSQAARGTFGVMAPGGRFSLNVWTQSQADVRAIINAFTRAGFREVTNVTGQVGSGTVITGVR